MGKDFETHSIGTAREIQYSRALAMAIEKELGVSYFSENVLDAYEKLKAHYTWQIENEHL
jgi:hypothetical protein